MAMATDPVCGWEIEEGQSPHKATHGGTTYYFCSNDCREEFRAAPEDYLGDSDDPVSV